VLLHDDLLEIGDDVARDAHAVGGPMHAIELAGREGAIARTHA